MTIYQLRLNLMTIPRLTRKETNRRGRSWTPRWTKTSFHLLLQLWSIYVPSFCWCRSYCSRPVWGQILVRSEHSGMCIALPQASWAPQNLTSRKCWSTSLTTLSSKDKICLSQVQIEPCFWIVRRPLLDSQRWGACQQVLSCHQIVLK